MAWSQLNNAIKDITLINNAIKDIILLLSFCSALFYFLVCHLMATKWLLQHQTSHPSLRQDKERKR